MYPARNGKWNPSTVVMMCAQWRQETKASHPPLGSEKLAANNDELMKTTISSQPVETGAMKADAS